MTDKKLTDSEIVKALEMLLDKIRAYECNNVSINYNLIVNILDLINRLEKKFKFAENINHLQMEEIQSLKEKNSVLAYELANSLQDAENKQAKIERLLQKTQRPPDVDPMDFCGVLCDFAEGLIKTAKAEAYKEFAERLKTQEFPLNVFGYSYIRTKIDNLLKELVGEDNAEEKE